MTKTKSYSALFLIDIAKLEAVDEVTKSITSVITDNSGNIVKDNLVGRRSLAYPINKKGEAVYYEVDFMAPPASIAEMSRLFRINTNLVHTLIDVKEGQ